MPISSAPTGVTSATYDPLFVDVLVGDDAAVGDGTTDDTVALQSFLTAAADTGATVLLGVHKITATLTVPSGVMVMGRDDDSRLILPADADFPALTLDAVTRTRVNRLRVTAAATGAIGACAVEVSGDSVDVVLEDVHADGTYEGFRIVGNQGATAGTIERIHLVRCKVSDSDLYGFRVEDVDGAYLTDCTSDVTGLDGVKLLRSARNVSITGGSFAGAVAGDGLDAYAGGGRLTIQGTIFSNNTLNGIVIKNDDLNLSDPATYGRVQDVTIMGVQATGNGGAGLTIHRQSATDNTDEPLVCRVSVQGGQFDNNTQYGIFIRARQVTVSGATVARNGYDGIAVDDGALDVSLIGCHVAGNSTSGATSYDGIRVEGDRVQIIGGSSIGADPDGATSDTDISNGTKNQRYGLRVEATASDVFIAGIALLHNATGALSDASLAAVTLPYAASATSSNIIIPNNNRYYCRDAAGTAASVAYYTTGDALNIGDSTNAEAINFLANGTATMFPKLACVGEVEIDGALNHDGSTVGFYGTAPVAKQTGVAVSAAGVHAALVALGLISA